MTKRIKLGSLLAAAVNCCITIAANDAAASGVQIIGYLGNFDVYNHTGSAMEGFAVDIGGASSGDLWPTYPTYCGSAFGCGQASASGGGLSVVYDGNKPGAYSSYVANGGITHFGVHLNKVPAPGSITYNWLDRNATDGQLYYAGTNTLAAAQTPPPAPPAPPEPVTQPAVVTPDWTFDGSQLVATIRNSGNRPIWVQGVSAENVTAPSLDDLMADHPLFDTLPMAEAQLLDPGDTLSEVEDIVASTVGGRAMFWVYAFTGDEALADEESGIYNARCDGGCFFGTHSGDLQSRMMTSANLGEVPLPAALPLFLSALAATGWLGRRRPHPQPV